MSPHGVDHHYAPLAIIELANGTINVIYHCRQEIVPLSRITDMLRAYKEDLKKFLDKQGEIEERLEKLEKGGKEIIDKPEPLKPAPKSQMKTHLAWEYGSENLSFKPIMPSPRNQY